MRFHSLPSHTTEWPSRNASIVQLLELGALVANYTAITPEQLTSDNSSLEELMNYEMTAFGEAILLYAGEKVIGTSPAVHTMLKEMDHSAARP